jgi:16S rRNA C967 or C1407 C5-methylase (RsmB/RsmF family)
MRRLLGDAYPAFCEAMERESDHALRLNRGKTDPTALLSLLPFAPAPLPVFDGGYLVPPGERPGSDPLHHAGAYYMQDPSAMATVSALPFDISGWRVLDLCAAPGGKSTYLADLVGEEGVLVSNEIVPSRARILLGNLERMGIGNAAVLSLDPRAVAELFDRTFDLAVVDAPCSGEGMFRKYPEAADEWSPAGVTAAAERGALILAEAAKTVREGGYLLFSTCTFAEEENEANVAAFLGTHRDFELVPISPEVAAVTRDGICGAGDPDGIALTRRFYPHIFAGEGQYIALLHRTGGGVGGL